LLNSRSTVREVSVADVRDEIRRVLSSHDFRQSKVLAKLLRYICTKALLEAGEPVTEYTIAVDVLGKPQDFKDNRDANVRVEVYRLRKRLAEYYQQEGAGNRVRIVIPTGTYLPQFLYVADAPAAALISDTPLDAVPVVALPAEPTALPPQAALGCTVKKLPLKWILSAAAILVISTAALVLTRARPNAAFDAFWRPLVDSASPILLCVGDSEGAHRPDGPLHTATNSLSLLQFHQLPSQAMLVDDAITLANFTGVLRAKGRPYRIVTQTEATFTDLQNGPSILIGLANNDWTEQFVDKLRFTVEHRVPGKILIHDRQQPARDDWMVDYHRSYVDLTKDYALVIRAVDPKTEQMVISAAGISVFGTLAAGEFLTNPREFRKIERVAPKGWQKMNFEIVLSTDVIRGQSGHPNLIAWHFW
jgi:hypothetical protein